MSFQVINNFSFTVEMTGAVFGIELSHFRCILKTSVEEVLDAKFAGEFVETNTPVDLGFLSNGKAVCIGKDIVHSFEGFAERSLVVGVYLEYLHASN